MYKRYASLLVKCGFLLITLVGLAQAQQTLTFSNTNVQGQPISIALLAGSTVTLAPTGNMSANCVLASGSTVCAGLPSGGTSGAAPSVSLAAGSFSQSPNTSGAYPAGTSVTLTPTVSNAEVCVRSSSSTTPTTTWTGLLTGPPFSANTITLSNPSSAYQFGLRCYGAGGATTFNLPSITTQEGVAPPVGCSAPPPGQPAFVGFSGPTRRAPPSGFLDLLAFQGTGRCVGDFPNTTSVLCLIHTQRSPNSQYVSLRFVAPAGYDYSTLEKFFDWDESQVRGAAQPNSTYVTISQCPGDFRIPPLGATAPSNDPTYAAGCRNLFNAGRVEYLTGSGPSTATKCMINPGDTYYFNYVRGVPNTVTNQIESADCVSGSTECGIQMQVR